MLYMHEAIHHHRDGTVTVRRWFSQNGKPRRKWRGRKGQASLLSMLTMGS